MPDKGAFCRKHTWKICIAGFFSDLCGACILLAVYMIASEVGNGSPMAALVDRIEQGVAFDPFSSIAAFLIVAVSVAVAGLAIYFFDRNHRGRTPHANLARAGVSRMNKENLRKITDLRHELHMYPELSMQERETAERIKRFLQDNTHFRIVDRGDWFTDTG